MLIKVAAFHFIKFIILHKLDLVTSNIHEFGASQIKLFAKKNKCIDNFRETRYKMVVLP